MRWMFWLVFLVGAVVIVSTIFKLIWTILTIPLMFMGVLFSFLFGVLPALLLAGLVLSLFWACGQRRPLRPPNWWRCGGWVPRWRPPWRRWM